MNTTATPCDSLSSSSSPALGAQSAAPKPGRPSGFSSRVVEALLSIIRETGLSDSGAAARASVHPSTVSRWKREYPDFAILLRSAREEFRAAQLAIILETARAGQGSSWRAAAWLLERTFPEDYSPRARERAQFREHYEAVCASEGEGGEMVLPGETEESARPTKGAPLQNVQNAEQPAARGELLQQFRPVIPLQIVQKAVLTGQIVAPSIALGATLPQPPCTPAPQLAAAC